MMVNNIILYIFFIHGSLSFSDFADTFAKKSNCLFSCFFQLTRTRRVQQMQIIMIAVTVLHRIVKQVWYTLYCNIYLTVPVDNSKLSWRHVKSYLTPLPSLATRLAHHVPACHALLLEGAYSVPRKFSSWSIALYRNWVNWSEKSQNSAVKNSTLMFSPPLLTQPAAVSWLPGLCNSISHAVNPTRVCLALWKKKGMFAKSGQVFHNNQS